MARSSEQWYAILTRCGVAGLTASKWSPIFADTIKDGTQTFSQGDGELDEFLGQVLHESGGLEYMRENLNYRAERIQQLGMKSPPGSRWRSLVPRAGLLAHNPRELANALYGGRMGNTEPDDGWNFIGRSPLQITGRNNYQIVGDLMGQDLTVIPQLLEQPHYALEATIAWWEGMIPDTILGDDVALRKRVNGGTFGLGDTERLAQLVRDALAEEGATS